MSLDQEKRKISQRKAQAKYHAANRDKYRKARSDQAASRQKWFSELKATKKCERCPEDHPACLQFHHVDPALKLRAIADMVKDGYGVESILKEIAKCIVLCGNCHSKEHYNALQATADGHPAIVRLQLPRSAPFG